MLASVSGAAMPSMVLGQQDTPNGQDDSSTGGEAVLQATSSGRHLWMLVADPVEASDEPFQLRYYSPDMGGPYFAPLRRLGSRPEHLLAVGDRLYTFLRRTGDSGGKPGWDVFSLQVLYNEPFDAYYAQPRGRMQLSGSLPDVDILGLTEHRDGPVALVHAQQPIETDDLTFDGHALLQLRPTGWVRRALPELGSFDRIVVGSDMSDGRRLIVLTASSSAPDTTVVHRSESMSEPWTSRTIGLDLSTAVRLTRVDDRAVIVAQPHGASTTAGLLYLRPSSVLALMDIKVPEHGWDVLGLDSDLCMLTIPSRGIVEMTTIDAVTGTPGAAQEMRPHPTRMGRIWLVALALAGAVSVTMLLILIRPVPKEPVNPPRDKALLPPTSRLAALAIDMFPAAVLTMLATGCSLRELFQAPLMTQHIIMSTEYLLLVALTMLHSTATELVKGVTLGKAMLGGQVVGHDGQPVTRSAAALRALGKTLTLLIPPIAIVALFNRNYQGLGDLLAQTLVVREVPQPSED